MKSFREWKAELEEQEFINSPEIMAQTGPHAWKASKDEIINHWQKLPPALPMGQMRSVPVRHEGPTYNFDGLRITGSSHWIDFVLSRLKDVLQYESAGGTRLQVIYKQIVDNKTQQPIPESFVFYIQVKQRAGTEPKLQKPRKMDKIPQIKLPKMD